MSRMPSSFDVTERDLDDMTFGERIIYHCKKQPLVPIGCLLTTGAVILAAQNVRLGNKWKAQYYFRWRVGLQAATLVALVAGSFIYGASGKELKAKEEQLKEKAKMREKLWIQELERREEETEARRKRAELARMKTLENEEEIKNLEKELSDLENKLGKK
ncbi:BAH_G0039480.mRNA.1.CDS.1 [Saccharomyces cerevisiae]|nr:BAH_G0039480.mRNA.1.CDS.1 [Saccharomyces cerevisiae]CAI7241571.1 BAH_G0039480.mRNA.1.CDS.1 [Saccharomyces cerevisiae]